MTALTAVQVPDEVPDVQVDAPASTRPGRLRRRCLIAQDTVVVLVVWLSVLSLMPEVTGGSLYQPLVMALTATIATISSVGRQRLYRWRVARAKAVEAAGLARAAAFGALFVVLMAHSVDLATGLRVAMLGGVIAFVLLRLSRLAYRRRMDALRRKGALIQRVILIGANEEAFHMAQLAADHPEVGLRIEGVVGDKDQWLHHGFHARWLGPLDDCMSLVARSRVAGVLLATTAVPSDVSNDLVPRLLDAGVHVQLSAGLQGVATRRIVVQDFGQKPFLYIEMTVLDGWRSRVKRGLDIVLASAALLLAAPVVAFFALLIRGYDKGPALFRQQRVGRGGASIEVLKLRTMEVDAEERLQSLREDNERTGPLFKLSHDPRVTPVGRFLRATSIDELPQLFNVLRGDMSLVGPRPALLTEVATFSPRLQGRSKMTPGITGLWQVTARDEPSFSAYERLDLFYIDNWSVTLDLMILASTVWVVVRRSFASLRRPRVADGELVSARGDLVGEALGLGRRRIGILDELARGVVQEGVTSPFPDQAAVTATVASSGTVAGNVCQRPDV